MAFYVNSLILSPIVKDGEIEPCQRSHGQKVTEPGVKPNTKGQIHLTTPQEREGGPGAGRGSGGGEEGIDPLPLLPSLLSPLIFLFLPSCLLLSLLSSRPLVFGIVWNPGSPAAPTTNKQTVVGGRGMAQRQPCLAQGSELPR